MTRSLKGIPGNAYAILAMLVLFSLLSPHFMSLSNAVNILEQGGILAIVSIAAALAILSHGIDLSLGATVGLVGVASAQLMNAGLPMPAAIGLGLLLGLAVGAANGLIIGLTRVAPFIVTLGMMGMAEGLSLALSNGTTIPAGQAAFRFIGGGSIGILPVSTLIALACYFLFWVLLKRTPFGNHVYALGGNEDAAALSGINIPGLKTGVYALNGLLAGLAGVILASRLGAANPSQGIGVEFDGIAAAVVGGVSLAGGKGSLWGVLMGAVIISILRNGLNMALLPTALQMVILGLILVAILTIDALRK
jgi:ribose transport system permease protein